jgi:hypothetical protein
MTAVDDGKIELKVKVLKNFEDEVKNRSAERRGECIL